MKQTDEQEIKVPGKKTLKHGLLGMRVEKDNSIAGGKTWQIGKVVNGIETQAKAPGFGDLQLLN